MDYLLGIDTGTSAFKAALFDVEGNMVASSSKEYALLTPSPVIVEMDALQAVTSPTGV